MGVGQHKITISIITVLIASTLVITLAINLDKKRDDDAVQIKYLIGMSQANLEEYWRIEVNKSISEAAEVQGMRVIYTDALQDSQKQINDIRNLINYGVDLLIISPNDVNALEAAIEQANKEVPVIIMDRKLPGDGCDLFIGTDNKQIGIDAGQYALDYLGPAGGNVIEIIGQEDSPLSIDRSDGFRQSISQNKNIKIVKTIIGDWSKDKSEDTFKQVIIDYPKIDLVFAQNDEMALGASLAAAKLRIQNICFIGVGGLPGIEGGIQLVKEGILNCTFANTTGGSEVIDFAIKLLDHEKGLPKTVIIKNKKITKETMDIQFNE